jgi:hypothetical protein
MIACLLMLGTLLRVTVRNPAGVGAESLLLRQRLAVLTRPTRKSPPLRTRDKLVWLLARLL